MTENSKTPKTASSANTSRRFRISSDAVGVAVYIGLPIFVLFLLDRMTIISLSEPIPLTIALTLFGVMAAYTSQTVCDGSLIPFRIMMVLALTSGYSAKVLVEKREFGYTGKKPLKREAL